MNDKYILYALAFGFLFVSAFVLFSFSEVNIPEDKFTRLYFNSTILKNDDNRSVLNDTELKIIDGKIKLDGNNFIRPDESFLLDGRGYTLNLITSESILLYNFTRRTEGLVYFDFTIENLEGVDKDYTYQILINEDKKIKESIFLKNDERITIQKSIEFTKPGEHRLIISLNTGQEIYFNFFNR